MRRRLHTIRARTELRRRRRSPGQSDLSVMSAGWLLGITIAVEQVLRFRQQEITRSAQGADS
jgi:hypothetical protein